VLVDHDRPDSLLDWLRDNGVREDLLLQVAELFQNPHADGTGALFARLSTELPDQVAYRFLETFRPPSVTPASQRFSAALRRLLYVDVWRSTSALVINAGWIATDGDTPGTVGNVWATLDAAMRRAEAACDALELAPGAGEHREILAQLDDSLTSYELAAVEFERAANTALQVGGADEALEHTLALVRQFFEEHIPQVRRSIDHEHDEREASPDGR
jgi:hypothetical protein